MPELAHRRDEMDAVRLVAKSRSVCALASWAIEGLVQDINPPETKLRRFELYEGVAFALELSIQTLGEALEAMTMD